MTAAAPWWDRLLVGRPRAEAWVDGLVTVAVLGVLVLHVVPAGLDQAGAVGALALVAGLAAGTLTHRVPHGEAGAAGVSFVALVVHGLTDGVALALPEDHGWLAPAVVLHTGPLALATWRIASERGGARWAIAALLGSALATVLGFLAGGAWADAVPLPMLGALQCAAAGALLHVLVDRRPAQVLPSRWAGLGALVGLSLVAGLSVLDPQHVEGRATAAWSVVALAAEAVLLGVAADVLAANAGERVPVRVRSALRGAVPAWVLLGPWFALAQAAGSAALPGRDVASARRNRRVVRDLAWVPAALVLVAWLDPLVRDGLVVAIDRPAQVASALLFGVATGMPPYAALVLGAAWVGWGGAPEAVLVAVLAGMGHRTWAGWGGVLVVAGVAAWGPDLRVAAPLWPPSELAAWGASLFGGYLLLSHGPSAVLDLVFGDEPPPVTPDEVAPRPP